MHPIVAVQNEEWIIVYDLDIQKREWSRRALREGLWNHTSLQTSYTQEPSKHIEAATPRERGPSHNSVQLQQSQAEHQRPDKRCIRAMKGTECSYSNGTMLLVEQVKDVWGR